MRGHRRTSVDTGVCATPIQPLMTIIRRDRPWRRRGGVDVRDHAPGQRGRRVLVLDHAPQAGAKILISGGGRCNFTNTGTVPERFLSDNPHFCRSALSRYTPVGFRGAGAAARHRVPREDARSVVLRRVGAGDRRHAAGGMRRGRRRCPASGIGSSMSAGRTRFRVETDHEIVRRRAVWCWPPAGCRSQRWAPPGSPTNSPVASACG